MNMKKNRTRREITVRRIPRFLLCAAAAVLCCALTLWLFGSRYETNDDSAMANIASGAFGEDSERLVFCNFLFGFIIKAFYAVFPGVAWYFFLSMFLVCAAFAFAGLEMTERFGFGLGLSIYAVTLASVGVEVFARFQFTKNAAVLLASGMLVLVGGLGKERRKVFAGAVLCAFGVMIRWECALSVLGVFAFALLKSFLRLEKSERLNAVKSVLVVAAALLVLPIANNAYYNTDGWNGYISYNKARADFFDYKLQYARDVELVELGLTDTEISAIKSWNVYDKFFSAELLNGLGKSVDTPSFGDSASKFAKTLPYLFFANGCCVLLILSAALVAVTGDKRALLFGALIILTALGEMLLLSVSGRLPYRVEQAIVFSASLALLSLADKPMPSRALLLTILALAACVPFALSVKNENDDYFATFNDQTGLTAYFEDKDTLFILDTAQLSSAMGYDVFHPRERNYFSNVVFLGGWLTNSGFQRETLAKFGEEGPYEALSRNENARLIWYLNLESILAFTREHYDERAALLDNGNYLYSITLAENAGERG